MFLRDVDLVVPQDPELRSGRGQCRALRRRWRLQRKFAELGVELTELLDKLARVLRYRLPI
jgi:hypothetical protein